MSDVIGLSKEKVTLSIMGTIYEVPRDKLLYVFQDLEFLRARNKFCWNGECKNCTISYSTASEPSRTITERACQTTAEEGLRVTDMPGAFYLRK